MVCLTKVFRWPKLAVDGSRCVDKIANSPFSVHRSFSRPQRHKNMKTTFKDVRVFERHVAVEEEEPEQFS